MAGKKNTLWMQTMIEKHGSREGVTEFMRSIGQAGGSKSHPKTRYFFTNREAARLGGAKGGMKSRRGKSKVTKIIVK